ncbi:MAG: hypothetical protein LUF28_07380 [Clostridiales bacterium]|nr:hypothetical protein [Clostridiales bacterium]
MNAAETGGVPQWTSYKYGFFAVGRKIFENFSKIFIKNTHTTAADGAGKYQEKCNMVLFIAIKFGIGFPGMSTTFSEKICDQRR